jgi:uncharacterized protein YecE (DUF72 family)
MNWRLGTMGFGYADWAGVFYPVGTKPSDYLAHYAHHFNAVELDTTFHAAPDIARVEHWVRQVPERFRFCAKTPKQITHEPDLPSRMRLMLEFVDVMRRMGDKLGVILLQFSPYFKASAAE